MKSFHKSAAALLSIMIVQGCGGSSSTVSGAATAPVSGTFTSTGSAIAAPTTVDPGTGSVEFGDVSPTTDPVLEFDIENNVLLAIRVNDSAVDFELDLTDPTTQFAGLPNGLAIANADMSTVAIFGFDDRRDFEYQSYGAWMVTDPGNTGTVGSGSFGEPTPSDRVPTGITFYGGGTGIYQDASGETFATSTEVVLWIFTGDDFIQMNSENTIGINTDTGVTVELPDLDILHGTGRITGNSFQMEGVLVSPLGPGVVEGTFYGPDGQEVGGTFAFENTTASHVGSFGAAR